MDYHSTNGYRICPLLIFGSEVLVGFGTYIVYFLLFLCLLGVITVGILSAITASYINKSGVSDNNGTYKALLLLQLLLLLFSFY